MVAERFTILLIVMIVMILAFFVLLPSIIPRLPSATPEEMGLIWQKCSLKEAYSDYKQATECFGHPMPIPGDEEGDANLSKRIDMQNFQLQIGQDTFHTSMIGGLLSREVFVLFKNGWPMNIMAGNFYALSPNIGLKDIGGKVVWEFVDNNFATVIYDGQGVRRKYCIDKAYRPFGLDAKLLFIGQKGDKFFVVYDGVKILPAFDHVRIAYCCEGVMYSVMGGGGRYLSYGKRGGQDYLIEITGADK